MTAQPSIPEPRKSLGDEMLTLDEAAALLRVPENTLRYWRVTGAGPRSFKVGRTEPRGVVGFEGSSVPYSPLLMAA